MAKLDGLLSVQLVLLATEPEGQEGVPTPAVEDKRVKTGLRSPQAGKVNLKIFPIFSLDETRNSSILSQEQQIVVEPTEWPLDR